MRYIIKRTNNITNIVRYWYNDGSHNPDCVKFTNTVISTIASHCIVSRICDGCVEHYSNDHSFEIVEVENTEPTINLHTEELKLTNRKMEQTEKRELRMYSLVLYQLSGIQSGIQSGHSNDEYGNHSDGTAHEDYLDWRKNYKTVMVMNGGSSGILIQKVEELRNLGIKVIGFQEPDLYGQYTSFSFLLDERYFKELDMEERVKLSGEDHVVRNLVAKFRFHGGR
jgi:hypothetical protein